MVDATLAKSQADPKFKPDIKIDVDQYTLCQHIVYG